MQTTKRSIALPLSLVKKRQDLYLHSLKYKCDKEISSALTEFSIAAATVSDIILTILMSYILFRHETRAFYDGVSGLQGLPFNLHPVSLTYLVLL